MSSGLKGSIAIAGVIGVGKTTLADNLAAILDGTVVYEKYKENPFLARQFSGSTDFSLPSELFFLLSRAQQLASEYYDNDSLYISDYIFQKNRFFASMSLDQRQMAIYDEIETAVSQIINKPDLVIYLYDSVENCKQRILSRGRDFEQGISIDFLTRLHAKYENLFNNWTGTPLIKINCSQQDMRLNSELTILADKVRQTLALH